MLKGLFKFFRKADVEVCAALNKFTDGMNKASEELDRTIEKNIKKRDEAQKDGEQAEKRIAKEAGFETVEEWRQHVDKMINDIMKR